MCAAPAMGSVMSVVSDGSAVAPRARASGTPAERAQASRTAASTPARAGGDWRSNGASAPSISRGCASGTPRNPDAAAAIAASKSGWSSRVIGGSAAASPSPTVARPAWS